jgi:methyl-accepting chemotaxis protein
MSRQAVRRVEASQETIRGLSESTALIGDVVQLIKSIAGQTNLLALNATIEAARAGVAGKGFAVVAGEVKALAGQTAKATADIASQIDKVRQATEATIGAMTDIGGMIGRMDQAAGAVAVAVQEQSTTTHAVAESIKTVSSAIEASAREMAQVIAVADQQAVKASEQLLFGVTDIGQEVEKLKSVVDGFLDEVRNEAVDRRLHERFDGRSAIVLVRTLPDAEPMQAMIKDLSRGGAGLEMEAPPNAGAELSIEMPDGGGSVRGTVIRSQDRAVSVRFAEDDETRAQVEQVLRALVVDTPSVAA